MSATAPQTDHPRTATGPLAQALAPLHARWSHLAAQERQMLVVIALVLVATLLWAKVLAPARTTLRTADAQAQALGAQLQHMQGLQAQAQALQKQPALGWDDTVRALSTATQQTLGTSAQLSTSGERATVTLKGTSADALAQWLVQARVNARSVPVEARLVRASAEGTATWDGVLLMSLPQR